MRKFTFMLIALLALVVGRTQAATPVDELVGKQIASVGDAVTTTDAFDGETWFVFKVGGTGRTGYAYYNESAENYYNSAVVELTGISTSTAAVYLFKVSPNEDGATFTLEDGAGHYLALDPDTWSTYAADEVDTYSNFYIANPDADTDASVWYLYEASGTVILDTNANGYSLAGWGTVSEDGAVTSTTGNNAMQFLPVTLEDADEEDSAYAITSGLYTKAGDNATELSTDKWYYINNCPNGDRTGWIYRSGTSYYNAESAPDMNTLSEDVTNYLFRFVENEDGTYYIVDGDGYYFSLSTYSVYGSLLAENTWTISKIDEESDAAAFSALSTGTSYYLDTNGAGYTVAGWPGTPTVDGNECVYFVEVLFDDETFLTADAAPAELAGRYAIELGEFSSEDYSDAASLTTSFNGKITVDEDGMVLLTGLIGTPSYSYMDWDAWMSVAVDSSYVGYYNEADQTITFVWPEEEDGNAFEIIDSNYDSWALASRFTVSVSQNDEGLYVLSTEDAIPFTYSYNAYTVSAAGVTMTQKQNYTIAEEDLIGTWQLTYPATNSWGEATGEDATLTFEIGYNDEGELILYNFGDLDYEFALTYNGTSVTLPYTYVSEWDEETYDTTFWLYFDTLKQTGADVDLLFGENNTILIGDDGLYLDAFGTEIGDDEIFYYMTEGTAVKLLGSAISSLDELDNETTYLIYNDTFTTYMIYNEDLGDEYVGGAGMIGDDSHTLAAETPAVDATLAAHNWMVYKKAGYYYIYNIALGKYFVGPTDDVEAATFTDAATPVYFTELGDGKFALNAAASSADASWYDYNFACAAPQLATSTPIAAWTSDDSGSAWQFIPTYQVEAAEASVFDGILTDAAPAELAGRYSIVLGEFTSEDYSDAASLETSFSGKISVDEDGKVLLTGLIGTPSYYEMDWDTWMSVEVDSSYVGYYNAQEGIIEFFYPQATEDGNEFDMIDDNWDDWQLSGSFTVSVTQNEDGLYVLSSEDLINFIYSYYEYIVSATGVTMTQIQEYEIEKDALVGLWTLTYPTVNSWGEELGGESTVNLIIAEDEEGELYISNFGGLEYTIPVTYENTYLTIPYIYEFAYDSETWETTSYVFVDDQNGAGNGAELYFGEDNTLIIGDESLQVYAYGTDFGDDEYDYWINSGTAQKAVEITPESGEYEEFPTQVVIRTYGWDLDDETVVVNYRVGSSLRGTALESDYYVVDADSIVITVPTDAIEGEYYLTLTAKADDVKGYTVKNLGSSTITVDYSTPVPSNTYTIETIEPSTEETQASLSVFTITMSVYNNLIGGFDETKTIELLSEDGETVTTATIVRDEDETSMAIITLAEEVTEEGTYTLVIPEGLIYDSSYNAEAEDLGVADGAIYNPEFTATYTVALVLGEAITSLSELSTETAYVIYNEAFTTYMIYDAESSDTYVWGAGMVGDDSHTLSAETPEVALDDPAHSWMIGEKDGNYYIYNLGLGKYFVSATDDYEGAHFSETATKVYIEQLGDITFSLNSTTTDDTAYSDYYFACAAPQLVASGTPIAWWTSDDSGSAWQFIANPNVEADASFLEGIETGITTVSASENAASGIYTLSGVKLNATDVRKLPKGVYVVDGVKVLVK